MADASTQYKLIVLYMLDQVDFPLTNTQISNFMLDKDYTTYFTVQKAISELIDAGLMRTESHTTTPTTTLRLPAERRSPTSLIKFLMLSNQMFSVTLQKIKWHCGRKSPRLQIIIRRPPRILRRTVNSKNESKR